MWTKLEASAWVRDGKADAPRVVYTFSDANCPYCHKFWEAARPWVDAGKVQLRHIMVGVIREDSPAKAAAILSARDPSAALLENEHQFDRGGIKALPNISREIAGKLDANQVLMLEMGFQGTPGILFQDAQGQCSAGPDCRRATTCRRCLVRADPRLHDDVDHRPAW